MSAVTDIKNTKQKLILFQTTYTPTVDTIASEIPDGYKIVSLSIVPTIIPNTTVQLKNFNTFLVVEPISTNK